jgi:hypothetical protein
MIQFNIFIFKWFKKSNPVSNQLIIFTNLVAIANLLVKNDPIPYSV